MKENKLNVAALRKAAQAATVQAVYRHIRSDATAAASLNDWTEHHRLTRIARAIEQAYPQCAFRARFAHEPGET